MITLKEGRNRYACGLGTQCRTRSSSLIYIFNKDGTAQRIINGRKSHDNRDLNDGGVSTSREFIIE